MYAKKNVIHEAPSEKPRTRTSKVPTDYRAPVSRVNKMAKWFENEDFVNKVCELVYDEYKRLGKKGKPVAGREWTMLAAVVAIFEKEQENDYRLELISLGTGSKCLGRNQLTPTGNLLNDSHAEVIARRGFLRYLYQELQNCYTSKPGSIFTKNEHHKCSLREGVSFHLFTSHTPCGDASIFPKGEDSTLILNNNRKRENINLADQEVPSKCLRVDEESTERLTQHVGTETSENTAPCVRKNIENSDLQNEDTKWSSDIYRTGAKCVPDGLQDSRDVGSGYHSVGVLRTKPGRGDSTMSMSCSDKIMKWCVLGCQGALISYFLAKPVYFSSVVLGKCAYDPTAMRRAVFGRASSVSRLPEGYEVKEPTLLQGNVEFEHSRRKIEEMRGKQKEEGKLMTSSSAIIMVTSPPILEIAVNGSKQGVTKSNRDSQKSRLCICKTELFRQFKEVLALTPSREAYPRTLTLKTYKDFKNKAVQYNKAKQRFQTVFNTWLEKPSHLEQFTL